MQGLQVLPNMEAGRDSMGAVCVVTLAKQLKKRVFLVGGREREPGLSSRAECFDVERLEWIKMKPRFYQRDSPAACSFNG